MPMKNPQQAAEQPPAGTYGLLYSFQDSQTQGPDGCSQRGGARGARV